MKKFKSRKKLFITSILLISIFLNPLIALGVLNQGYICVGFLTAAGCGARCPNANTPCIGCYGPSPDILKDPAKFVARIQAIYKDGPVEDLINKMEDPVGVWYKAALPRTTPSDKIKK